ncbi:MAG: hypothetical protein AB9897_01355 [Anaerolineaceae bacterium]
MDNWLSLLIQVPLVGVFIWYSLEMNKRSNQTQKEFMDALDKRDDAFDKRNSAVILAIEHLNDSICTQLKEVQSRQDDHDRFVRDNSIASQSKSKSK